LIFNVQAEVPPVREDTAGALRIGNTRVLLELVIRAFQDGATPEAIVQRYSTLTLAEVYAVIAYYLGHPDDVDSYLSQREQQAHETEKSVQARQDDLNDIRQRLLARRQS